MAKKSAKKTAKKSTKKAAKKSTKKAAARKTAKKPSKSPQTAKMMPGARAATAQDGTPVALFFDKVESDLGLQSRVAIQNKEILDVAKAEGFLFTYDQMAEHLRQRWCIFCGPKEDYCCF